jgi:hypothetical protein
VPNSSYGASTWCNGTTGSVGVVSASNSLIGTTANDMVGAFVAPLTNGDYVVNSFLWQGYAGAATWGNGTTGIVGSVSASNSLIGTTANDRTGINIAPLSNGSYVVLSSLWNNGVASSYYGAVTWGGAGGGTIGPVSTSNSLYGTTLNDEIGVAGYGGGMIALASGNYVVGSSHWNNGIAGGAFGAVTWGRSVGGTTGPVAAGNSLIGTTPGDSVGSGGVLALADGNYLVQSPNWDNGAITDAGAMTLASGRFRLKGQIQPWNSVLGGAASGGSSMVHDYDASRHRLAVGRPAENIVSLFTMDQIFAGDLEQ